MDIKPLDFKFIDKKLRKRSWTTCYFFVHDVGHRTVWGYIIDSVGHFREFASFPLTDEDWEFYEDARTIIALLPEKL